MWQIVGEYNSFFQSGYVFSYNLKYMSAAGPYFASGTELLH